MPHGAAVYLVATLAAGPAELTGPEGRHALVRRTRVGEQIVLVDGAGSWSAATVLTVDKARLRVDVGLPRQQPAPRLRVMLVQAVPKGERAELAVDLATEAGVDEIVPWMAQRCVVRWSGEKSDKSHRTARSVDRWRSAAREAAKQARRPWVPTVHDPADLAGVAGLIRSADVALLLHEDAGAHLASVSLPAAGLLVLVVGPEGGITPEELTELTAAGGTAVRLGPEVLRTSTAAAVALGALGVLTSRWAGQPEISTLVSRPPSTEGTQP